MTRNALRYCLRQVFAASIAALIPATFIGVLKFGSELASGRSVRASSGWALAFAGLTFFVIAVGASAVGLARTRKKTLEVGVSFDYLGSLRRDERRKFEKEHGI